MILSLLACGPKHAPVVVVDANPVTALARARAEPDPDPMAAGFSIDIEGAEGKVSARGSLVVFAPDRFRIEIRGPIGPAVVVVVCDGHSASAWIAGKNRFYTSADADAALRRLAGGAAGIQAVTSLLMGRLPDLEGEPMVGPGGLTWERPGDAFTTQLDPTTAHLRHAVVTADGRSALEATWEPGAWPSAMTATLHTMGGVSVSVDFDDWKAVFPPDSVFSLTAPAGAEVLPFPGG